MVPGVQNPDKTIKIPDVHVIEGEGDAFSKNITRVSECRRLSYHKKKQSSNPNAQE
jgi:hypothetical protein